GSVADGVAGAAACGVSFCANATPALSITSTTIGPMDQGHTDQGRTKDQERTKNQAPGTKDLHQLSRRDVAVLDEIRGAGFRAKRRRQDTRQVKVLGNGERVLDEISRMAAAHGDVARTDLSRQQVLDNRWVEVEVS